jgi:hypothetical protein
VIAKLELFQIEDGAVTPVDYKHGSLGEEAGRHCSVCAKTTIQSDYAARHHPELLQSIPGEVRRGLRNIMPFRVRDYLDAPFGIDWNREVKRKVFERKCRFLMDDLALTLDVHDEPDVPTVENLVDVHLSGREHGQHPHVIRMIQVNVESRKPSARA